MSLEHIGKYEVLAPLGRGGVARVDLARTLGDAGFVRVVALKRLHANVADSATMVARFYDEAALAARIRHANVVSVIDVLLDDGKLAIAYELVVGIPLRALLRQSAAASIPTAIATRIAIDILEGLHAAHTTTDEHGAPLSIVHRDVSAANVLIDESGTALVTDFGLATARKRLAETAPGDLHGTLAYMSPERIRGNASDARCDVWAAAVLLWEMLSGRRLFGGPEGELVWRILEGVIPPAGAGRSDVSAALVEVVAKGLAREPNARYSSAREMALAIESVAPPAPSHAVATWLEQHMGAVLAEQRERVRAAHRGEYVADVAPSTLDPRATASIATKPPHGQLDRAATLRDVTDHTTSMKEPHLGRTLPSAPPAQAPPQATVLLPPDRRPLLPAATPDSTVRALNRTAPLVSAPRPPAAAVSSRPHPNDPPSKAPQVPTRSFGPLVVLAALLALAIGALGAALISRRGGTEVGALGKSNDATSTVPSDDVKPSSPATLPGPSAPVKAQPTATPSQRTPKPRHRR